MVLFVVGLGLGDEKDITVRGLEAVKSSKKVFLEAYTSILMVDDKKLVRGV
jgi:diphthine synthase